jgi:membrane protease YdiL (CAAX protease family)
MPIMPIMIDLLILLGSLLVLLIYKKIQRYDSLNGLFLFVLFIILLIMRLVRTPHFGKSLFNASTLNISGLIMLIVTVMFFLIILYFKKHERHGQANNILILLAAYLVFGLAQQVFFQLIFLNTVSNITHNFYLAILLTSLFFGLFHLKKKYYTLFVFTFLLNIFWSSIYLLYSNILWPVLSHAVLAVFYYVWIRKGNALKKRLSFIQ